MHDWLGQALRDVSGGDNLFEIRRNILRYRDAIDRLRLLELRDRWGYRLEEHKLAQIVAFVEHNADRDGLANRSRSRGAMVEIVDRLAVEMLTGELPQFCSGQDTPAEDELIETVVRAALNLKEPS